MSTTTSQPAAAEAADDRATAKALIDKLPPGTTLEQIEYHVGVAALLRERGKKIDEILAMGTDEAVRRGLLIPHDQMKREIESWFKK